MHGAGTKNKPGGGPATHGRYSRMRREALRELIEQFQSDPAPLDIFPELAASRALFQDFIDRYDEFAEALIAWHQSYQTSRPIDPEKAMAFLSLVDDYEELVGYEDDLTDRQQKQLKLARQYVDELRTPNNNKPVRILDISDAYRIVSEITKIAERIEKIRAANAIARPELARILHEMARVVTLYVEDQKALEQIKLGWSQIRL
jgi:hypothetical protein